MGPFHRRTVTCVMALLAVAFVGSGSGCGSSETGGASSGGGSTPVVEITDYEYIPADRTAAAGAEVTFTNNDGLAHTATADNGKGFETGRIRGGESATVAIPSDATGTIAYHCVIHPYMKGTITVEG